MDNPNAKDGMVRLWTRQDIRSLGSFERQGRFYNHEHYLREKFGDIAPYFMKLYQWFTEKATKNVPAPMDVKYPIWCSVAHEYMLRPVENEVAYEIYIPEERVVYFDSVRWDLVLNHMYIPIDEADDKAYLKHLEKLGVPNRSRFIDGREAALFPQEKKRVIDSWDRVFEVPAWDYFRIQANIWEIFAKDVVKVHTVRGEMTLEEAIKAYRNEGGVIR